MKIIDLLNKIANGEIDRNNKYQFTRYDYCTINYFFARYIIDTENLNLEIIEEPQEHKIPEKIKIEQDTPNSNFYIRTEYGTKHSLTKLSKMIVDKINEIIDYLEVNNGIMDKKSR